MAVAYLAAAIAFTLSPVATAQVLDECATADALAKAKQTESARRAYVRVIRANPGSACAQEGLTALATPKPKPTPTRDACQAAEELAHAGAEEKAKEVLQAEIQKSESDCAPAALAKLNRDPLDEATTVLAGVGKLLALLALLLALLALGLLAVPQIRKRVRRAMGAQMVIGPIGDGGTEPKVGAPLTALVSERFRAPLDDDLALVSLNVVDQHQELADAVAELEKVSSKLAPAVAFVRFVESIVRPHRWTLSGQVLAPGTVGPGVAVQFRAAHFQKSAATFRRGALGAGKAATEEDFLPLAVPASAWARHIAIAELDALPASGTTSDSYAWLCAAIADQNAGDLPSALAAYEEAVRADPAHVRAQVGRALVAAELALDYQTEIRILHSAIELLDPGSCV